jgi:DNA-binding NtrC family response regulator
LLREIHRLSPRGNGPFIAINAAALLESLIEDELFGHEKGACTGAMERRAGCFEQADGGTLFLDEIGEMPVSTQPKLLRVLEVLRVQRPGGKSEIPVNTRALAATSHSQVAHLREELYYRLSVARCRPVPISVSRDRSAQTQENCSQKLADCSEYSFTGPFRATTQPHGSRQFR